MAEIPQREKSWEKKKKTRGNVSRSRTGTKDRSQKEPSSAGFTFKSRDISAARSQSKRSGTGSETAWTVALKDKKPFNTTLQNALSGVP